MGPMAKWFGANCTVIAALTALVPFGNTITSRPSRVPVANATPFSERSDALAGPP